MNLLHLHYFKLVADNENIAKAANKAYISPSGLSKVISRLESEIGYSLFYRSSNRIFLNPSGKIFYKFAAEMLRDYDDCLLDIKKQNENNQNIVSIAVPADALITGIVEKFTKEHPKVKFSQFVMSAAESKEALLNHEIDFAICHDQPQADGGIIWQELFCTNLCLAINRSHPMARAGVKKASLFDFKEELFLLHASSVDERNHIMFMCNEAGFRPSVLQVNADVAFEMMQAGRGIAVVQDYFFESDIHKREYTGIFTDGNKIAYKIAIDSPYSPLHTGILINEEKCLSDASMSLYNMICDYFQAYNLAYPVSF